MEKKILVIVESPTKARTIRKFLPSNYFVEASIGHVRDLPQSASDVPKALKEEPWANLGIDVEHDFAPLYITPRDKTRVVTQLKKLLKESDELYLATDEDREGESISWHLTEVLKPGKKPVRRMVFHEITKKAITEALEHTRDLDLDLVKAQETRRTLDRLYGYTLSPLLWKKIAYGLSAGRVQSPGLRLLVQREFERALFRKSAYWDLSARLDDGSATPGFEARLMQAGDLRVANGKDFDASTGELKEGKSLLVLDAAAAGDLKARLQKAEWKVKDTQSKESTSKPASPFITSTLQQEANRKLGLSSRDTMRMAQRLYEEGLITYMRTDSPTLSDEAVAAARKVIQDNWGKEFLSPEVRQYTAKSRNAQEAHEAIRPAGTTFLHPDQTDLSGKERQLYEMIWKRTIASQMADARKAGMTVRIQAGDCIFQATGSRILFPGFLRVYVEGHDDPEQALEDKEVILPALTEGQVLRLQDLSPLSHETKPPARYTEASLIQRLEKEGIGRPSTYASIIGVLYERNYVRKAGTAMVPTYTGIGVSQFLEKNFHELVEYSFTSRMETSLDDVAAGERDRLAYLKEFYLGDAGLKSRVDQREKSIKPEESRTIRLPQLADFSDIKIGRFGPYMIHKSPEGEEIHVSIPEDLAPGELTIAQLTELMEIQKDGGSPLGTDPATGLKVYCLIGRYGPFLQLGETAPEGPKPRRAPLPKDRQINELTLEDALRILSLPRTLGTHPDSGKEIVANAGRFGPYVAHDGEFRSLKKDDDVYTVSLERALEILSEEKKGRGGISLMKDFGELEGMKVLLNDGRYGPYLKVTDAGGSRNVALPDGVKTRENLKDMEASEVLEIIKASPAKPKTRKPGRKA